MILALSVCFAHSLFSPEPSVRFAFFGCNRVEKADIETYPSSANEPQLLQNLKDVAALSPRADFLFATGDIVMGYADDKGQVLKKQLGLWKAVADKVQLPKETRFIPMPGNHEMNRKAGDDKVSSEHTIAVWNDWYKASGYPIMSTNGPKNVAEAQQDQSILNYSFDYRNVHFVVLNTDSLTTEKDATTGKVKIGWVPVAWIQKDIEAAEQDDMVQAIFVLGHRNIIDPAESKGDAPIDPAAAEKVLQTFQASKKLRGYLCAHVHAWDLKGMGPTSWQVIAGNGGSKLEKGWSPKTGTYFGFSVIDVSAAGDITLHNYRRPTPEAPHKYCDDCDAARTPAKPTTAELYKAKG